LFTLIAPAFLRGPPPPPRHASPTLVRNNGFHPTPLQFNIYHTILVMTISYKGQVAGGPRHPFLTEWIRVNPFLTEWILIPIDRLTQGQYWGGGRGPRSSPCRRCPKTPISYETDSLGAEGALCAYVIRLRVSYNQNDDTFNRNSLSYLSKANSAIAVHY